MANVDVKDAAGVTKTMKTTSNSGVETPHHNIDSMPGTVVEDAASSGGETSHLMAGVRNDAAVSRTSADGDFGNLAIDAAGRMGISDLGGAISVDDNGGSLTVDGAVSITAVVPGTGATSLGKAEDAAHASSDVGVMALGVRQAADAPLSGSDGDYEPLQTDANGHLKVNVKEMVTHPVTNAGTFAIQDSEKLADNAAFTDGTTKVQPMGMVFDEVAGTALTENDIAAPRIDAKRAIVVTLEDGTTRGRRVTVSAAGAIAVDNSGNTQPVAGTVAHDAADSGNPVKVGGRARSSSVAAVSSDDRVDFIATLEGRQVVAPYTIPENAVAGASIAITGTTSTQVIAAAGAGLKNHITQILVMNSHATVSTWVNITDGSGGAVLQTVYAAALGGGAALTFPTPLPVTANTALHAINATTGANVVVSASGFKGA